jgi:predicted nucleic acid-binding protein
MDGILKEYQPCISAITEIELLCWKTANENDLAVLNSFINDSVVFELEKDIKAKTVALRKNHRIKLPDAIIAATAIVNDLTLLTRNVSDFQQISDLSFISPWDK